MGEVRELDPYYRVHVGDARDIAATLGPLPTKDRPLITCTITSPPYADLIDYKASGQVGWGQSYEEYLADCHHIFRDIYSNTADDGSLWLIADTIYDQSKKPSAVRPLPFDLAREASRAGWTLRDVIVWQKDKTRPWSGRGRLRNIFEYVLFLVKSDKYKYHLHRLRETTELAKWWVQYPERYNPQGKTPTNVWEIPIPTQGTWANSAVQHACPLPADLVERILFLSTDPGDVVFDPFAGSGTVVVEAERLARRGIGVELNPKYVDAYRTIVRPEVLLKRGVDQLSERLAASDEMQKTILRLRAVKYPKTMFKQYVKRFPSGPKPRLAVSLLRDVNPVVLRNPHQLIDVSSIFLHDGPVSERDELQRALKEVASQKPLTGFGVDGEILVVCSEELLSLVECFELFLYEHGRTWSATRPILAPELLSVPISTKRGAYIPIAANVALDERPHRLYA
ncbi:DNA-methyltransferase [Nonomuraea wenchangensis]|uniref:Methyltransferase n=1 Tax=Nonomuraea wenchangensis TaxID=568860 RepID=A0A1I0FIN8_9ACTN|nr:site-specific DNA-methyltransferase [Nonomuraea wenchangensis]SET57394.1 DNA modification methylase [Nonomuraea wenchangensis]